MSRKLKNIVLEKVRVEDHGGEGRSLARIDGKVIFIEQAVPGDIVDIRLTKNKKDWAEGKAIRFHEYSPDRVEPFCEHFGVCGGCQWQMLPYEKQLLYKHRQVDETLRRIGKIPLPPVKAVMGAQETRYYRNKIEYTFGNRRYIPFHQLNDASVASDLPSAGFHAKGLFDKVVDITTCHLQAEPSNRLRLAVKEYALDHDLSFYDIREHRGFLRTMQVRLCRSGELMVNIVFGEDDREKINGLMDHVACRFPEISTLLFTINTKMNDSLHNLNPEIYSGPGYVLETLEDFRFKIGPKSFFQTNTAQAEKLYQVTRSFAELSGKETVYDLYCGTGSIGIFLSRGARRIIGVEAIAEAVTDAQENAALNQLPDSRFFIGDAADVCTVDFFRKEGKPDVIVTDPPRAGMHPQLVAAILDMEAPLVVYVSCNPATQARDLNLLGDKYEVTAIQPVDMFPHTHHIENVVQLKRKK